MDDGLSGEFNQVSYTTNSLTQITVRNLTSGRAYRFKVMGANFNQISPFSNIVSFYACQAPSGLSSPVFVSNSANKMNLMWSEPSENGGCPILSYHLMRDNGITGTPNIEVNSPNDVNVRNIPTLRSLDVLLDVNTKGRMYTFQLFVSNREGTSHSQEISYLYASNPEAPSVAPYVLEYSSTSCTASYLYTDNNGGSDILSYNL